MSEEQKQPQQAEELTEWSEIDTSSSSEGKEKVEFEVEAAEETVEGTPPAPAPTSTPAPDTIPELEGIETKGAEKRIRQLVQQKKDRENRIAQLEAEQQQLVNLVNDRDKNAVDLHKNTYEHSQHQIQQQTELAKQAYLDAYDTGDKEKMLQAQQLLNKGQVDLNNIEQNKNQLAQYEKTLEVREQQAAAQQQQLVAQYQQQQQQQQAQTQAQSKEQYDPQAVAWSQKPENSWFGQDNIMTVAALTIDAQLKEEGVNPASTEFYQEVDSRMRKEFPHKFSNQGGTSARNTQQVVAGQSRSPTSSSSSKKVKLTQEDVRLAQKWNIPLEKYAAEKARADRAAGEYVPITA